MIIADQHAVDERVQLERILREVKKRASLNPPLRISLTRQEQNQIYSKTNHLSFWGFDLAIDGTGFFINSVPSPCKNRFIQHPDLLKSILLSVASGVNGKVMPSSLMDVCKSIACRGAVMFGTVLGRDACVELMREVSGCENPFVCAHGRPGIVPIAEF